MQFFPIGDPFAYQAAHPLGRKSRARPCQAGGRKRQGQGACRRSCRSRVHQAHLPPRRNCCDIRLRALKRGKVAQWRRQLPPHHGQWQSACRFLSVVQYERNVRHRLRCRQHKYRSREWQALQYIHQAIQNDAKTPVTYQSPLSSSARRIASTSMLDTRAS